MNTCDSPMIDAATRRGFLRALTALAGAAALPPARAAEAASPEHAAAAIMKTGSEVILIVLYPGFTAMDAMGPEYMLSCMAGAKVRFIAATRDPVKTESGFLVTPHLSFAECPPKPTLVLVPGGASGTLQALGDAALLAFLRKVSTDAARMGSVCTGSLLLGAAGLLDGYEATSHWQTVDLLSLTGAKPSRKRVVFDRDRVTGAGVTAGLDLGLALVREYRGATYAQGVQLLGEYDPRPDFPAEGNPATANPVMVKLLNDMHQPFIAQMGDAVRKARAATP